MRLLPFEDNEATLLGKLVHKALFTVYNNKRESLNLPANAPLPPLDKENDRTLLVDECKRLWQDTNEEFAGMIGIHRLNLLLVKNGVLDLLLEWLEDYELKFGFIAGERNLAGTQIGVDSAGVAVLLAGITDRIDASRADPSKFALVDFKTGKPNKEKVAAQTADGRLLQLPLYAITAKNELMKISKENFILHLQCMCILLIPIPGRITKSKSTSMKIVSSMPGKLRLGTQMESGVGDFPYRCIATVKRLSV